MIFKFCLRIRLSMKIILSFLCFLLFVSLVWADYSTWTKIYDIANVNYWTARSSHAITFLSKNKLILTGGLTSAGPVNDVWLSPFPTSGDWINVRVDNGYTPRYDFGLVGMNNVSGDADHSSDLQDNNLLILFGGQTQSGRSSDVWVSVNEGKNWNFIGNSGWSPRSSFATCNSADTIYVIGGFDGSTHFSDVWASFNYGYSWTLQNLFAPFGFRADASCIAFGNSVGPDSIIVVGGENYPRIYSDVWRSDNGGVGWYLVNGAPGFSPRFNHVLFYNSKELLVTGGHHLNFTDYYDDLWASKNFGKNWYQISPSVGYGARSNLAGDNWGTQVVITGGLSPVGPLSDQWNNDNPPLPSSNTDSNQYTTTITVLAIIVFCSLGMILFVLFLMIRLKSRVRRLEGNDYVKASNTVSV